MTSTTSEKTKKLVLSALFAAMTCVATMVITVPTPTNGYIHLGDGFVILSGILLGPVWGTAAAGIGSMFADLLLGYAAYAPATLIIKALAAFLASVVYIGFQRIRKNYAIHLFSIIIAGAVAGLVVTCGYFSFEATIMGYGLAAISGIPTNLMQNGFGICVSALLASLFSKIPVLKSSL